MSRITLLVSSALLAYASSMQVFASEVKYDGQSCYAGPIQLIQHADGFVAGSYAIVGMSPGWEGSPLKMISSHCLGAFSIVSGQYDENGTCEFVDADGDKMFNTYGRKGDPVKAVGTVQFVHGTGKFAGITGEGKFIPIGTFPPAAPNMATGCNHEWGTYNIK